MIERLLQDSVGKFADHPNRLRDPRILFGEVIPYSLESLPLPCASIEVPDYNVALANTLFPPELCLELTDMTSTWNPGQARGTVITVGNPNSGSSHPHLYELARTETGTRLLFVDPEHTVGRRNLLKPALNILMEAHIDAGSHRAEIAYLRHRTRGMPSDMLKLAPQYVAAQSLREQRGRTEASENEVTFRLVLDNEGTVIKSPLGTTGQLEAFIEQQRGHLPVEERVAATSDMLKLFPVLLREDGQGTRVYQKVHEQAERLKAA